MYGASTPADACVAPIPTGRSSTISTDAPRCASSSAIAQPTTPAPMTMMSEGCDIRFQLILLYPRTVTPLSGRFSHHDAETRRHRDGHLVVAGHDARFGRRDEKDSRAGRVWPVRVVAGRSGQRRLVARRAVDCLRHKSVEPQQLTAYYEGR